MPRMRIRLFTLSLLVAALTARADFRELENFPVDPSLAVAIKRAAEATLKEYPKLAADDLAITLIDVTRPSTIDRADLHGDAPFYPASVVKLFYMAETFHQHLEKNDVDTPRALHEMIRVSDNDATAYIVDTITDTCSGPCLDERPLRKFIYKRSVVNRWFSSMGYDISAMAKPWSFGPFGRDAQLMGGPTRPNRNRATTNSVAALMLWIVRGRAVSKEASDAMMQLLKRPLPPEKEENQVTEFIGEALPPGSLLWSKAGWTSEVRHDAAYFELPDGGKKLILVIFTRGIADDKTLIPSITKKVLANLSLP
jgi:beta-lactamase class A